MSTLTDTISRSINASFASWMPTVNNIIELMKPTPNNLIGNSIGFFSVAFINFLDTDFYDVKHPLRSFLCSSFVGVVVQLGLNTVTNLMPKKLRIFPQIYFMVIIMLLLLKRIDENRRRREKINFVLDILCLKGITNGYFLAKNM